MDHTTFFQKMSLLGHEFIDSSNVDPENQDELTINDINEFVPVFNRRMKLTSKTSVLHTQTRRWTNKAKREASDAEGSLVGSRVDGEQNTTVFITVDQLLQIDGLFTHSGSLLRKEAYRHEIEMSSLAYKFSTYLRNLQITDERTKLNYPPEVDQNIQTRNKPGKCNINQTVISNLGIDKGKQIMKSEDDISREVGDDCYSRVQILAGHNCDSEEFKLEQFISDHSTGDHVSMIDAKGDDLETPESRGDLTARKTYYNFGTKLKLDANNLQHKSKQSSQDRFTQCANRVLESIQQPQLNLPRTLDDTTNFSNTTSQVGKDRMDQGSSCNEGTNLPPQFTTVDTTMATIDEYSKREVKNLAVEAYHWAKEAFNFPKVKDYVANYESR